MRRRPYLAIGRRSAPAVPTIYNEIAGISSFLQTQQAALQSFASKGFSQTTMEDIRQLSGAGMGSIYHHFKNKEMLAYALYLEGRSDLNAHLRAALAAASPEVGVQHMVRAYLEWFGSHPDLGQYILQAGTTEFLGAYVKVLRQKNDDAATAGNPASGIIGMADSIY